MIPPLVRSSAFRIGSLVALALHRPPADAPASGARAPYGFSRPHEKAAF